MAGEMVTSVPGSSAYFVGGVMAYTDDIKRQLLGVKEEILADFGTVSEPCAREMAEGVQKLFGSTLAVGITGIAGPGGATKDKPVGTVCFACVGPGTTKTATKLFAGGREQVRRAAAYFGLDLARRYFDNRKR
jgi:PncC family amidohydrolase